MNKKYNEMIRKDEKNDILSNKISLEMIFTSVRDINILIVSFCDEFTIATLLEVDRQLILDAKDKIVKLNDIYFIASLVIILVAKKENELAKYFLEQCKDSIDDSEYREILLEGWNPALLKIYFSSSILDQQKIFACFVIDNEHLDREDLFNLFEGFYYVAVESKNLSIIRPSLDFWKNQDDVYDLYGEENTEEIQELKIRIELIDKGARKIV